MTGISSGNTASAGSPPPSSPPHTPQPPTAVTLESVALRLFHLLHSPPLSLATLVRAGLLNEDDDGVQGRLGVASTAKTTAAADRGTFPTAAVSAPPNASPAPLASPVNGAPPPHVGTTRVSASQPTAAAAAAHPSTLLPQLLFSSASSAAPTSIPSTAADTIGSPVTASTLSLSSPTAPGAATAYRIARISAETLARRLANLYARHPPYELRELLHREATRFGCPSYQDPVTNDITATADALRQREALVSVYTRLYRELHPRTPGAAAAAGSLEGKERSTSVASQSPADDPEWVTWARSLHLLLGCHHQRERHCPHRALDGHSRRAGRAVGSGAATAGSGGQAGARDDATMSDTSPRKPKGGATALPPKPRDSSSVALHFVQQLLSNKPASRRGSRAQAEKRSAVNGSETDAASRRSAASSLTSGENGKGNGFTGGATVTFVRRQDPLHEQARAVSDKPPMPAAVAQNKAASPAPARRILAPVTSLDCMIGLEGDAGEDDAAGEDSTASLQNHARDGAGGAAQEVSAAAAALSHRGRRTHPRHSEPAQSAAGALGSTEERGVDTGATTEVTLVLSVHDDPHALRRHRHRSKSSSSSSGSSSVSLSVVGEEEGDLLLPDVEDEEEGEGEEDGGDGEDSDSADEADDVDALASATTSNGQAAQQQGGSSSAAVSSAGRLRRVAMRGSGSARRLSAAPVHALSSAVVAATTTTVDFLASRNAGVLTGTIMSPLTNSASTADTRGTFPPTALPDFDDAAAAAAAGQSPLPHSTTTTMLEASVGVQRPTNPLLAGYTMTRPFTLAELPAVNAEDLLRLPYYAQAHELNRLACLQQRTCYQDPHTSCVILTSFFLERFPHCYGEYCKHCPHGEICERRQLLPPHWSTAQDSHHHHRRHKHHHHHHRHRGPAWQPAEEIPALTGSPAAYSSEWGGKESDLHNSNGRNDFSSASSDNSSSSGGSSLEDDDPEALRFFEELDAADAASGARGTPPPPPTNRAAFPVAKSGEAGSRSTGPRAAGAFAASLSASSSAPSSSCGDDPSSSSSSDEDDDEAEQHRHHLLRSAGLFPYAAATGSHAGVVSGGSAAGVVVQVSSLRDLLSWGGITGLDGAAITAAAAAGRGDAARRGQTAQVPTTTTTANVLSRALEAKQTSTDAALLVGDEDTSVYDAEAAALHDAEVEELLRQHEASFDRFSYLDYAAL